MSTPEARPPVNVVGLGLIGSSVACALRAASRRVAGTDLDPAVEAEALRLGIVDEIGVLADAELSIVAVPPDQIVTVVDDLLASTTGPVTDVGSVKARAAASVVDPRYVPGHPMAGNERGGMSGADPDLFRGAAWVLCPGSTTSDVAFATVAGIVRDVGAEVVVLDPARHDDLVAVISHLPHLAAATLMRLAARRADEHVAVLRLAAGGFRDMTRIASGPPDIWPGICRQNRTALLAAIDELTDGLAEMRRYVDAGDEDGLLAALREARRGRSNLPARVAVTDQLVEVRIPIPDRPGAAAEIFSVAAELGVNVWNFEVVHSAEGERGTLVMVLDRDARDLFRGGLIARGFRPTITEVDV